MIAVAFRHHLGAPKSFYRINGHHPGQFFYLSPSMLNDFCTYIVHPAGFGSAKLVWNWEDPDPPN